MDFAEPKEPPIADWEMISPYGRKPTPEQLEEWLNKDDENEEGIPAEKAFEQMKKSLAIRREKINKKYKLG